MTARTRLMGALALAALASACANAGAPVAATKPSGRAPAAKGSPAPSPSPRPRLAEAPPEAAKQASAAASAAPSAGPTPWPEAWPRLSPVKGAFSGTVKLDVGYLVGQGAGLISNNGAAILGPRGDNLLADPAIGLLSDHGGGLVSNNGSSLVSNNGSSLVSNNGSSALAPGSVGYGLLGLGRGLAQAEVAASAEVGASGALAVGTVAPVGGMMVTAYSLVDGKPLAPPVLSDAEGRFFFDLPAQLSANLRLEVAPPPQATAKAQADERLRYPTLAAQTRLAGVPVDEDTAQAAQSLAKVFRNQVRAMFVTEDVSEIIEQIGVSLEGPTGPIVTSTVTGLRNKALAVGYPSWSYPRQMAAATRVGDLLLADLDLGTLSNNTKTGYDGPIVPALPVVLDTMRLLREGATPILREDPKAFETAPFVQEQSATNATLGLPPVRIVKPSDYGALAGEAVLSDLTPGAMAGLDRMLAFVKQGELVNRTRVSDGATVQVNLVRLKHVAAANGLLVALAVELVKKQEQAKALLDEAAASTAP